MPKFVSPAQALFSNILHRVIWYSETVTKENWNSRIVDKYVARTMLSVCSSWRLAALDYIWRELQLTIDSKDNNISVRVPNHVSQINLPHNIVGLVRKLAIYVPMPNIVNGTAYKVLSKYMGDMTSLPAANRLIITVVDPAFDSEYPKDSATANVLEFAQLLESLTPAETMTKVTYANRFNQLDECEEEYLGVLANLLYNRSRHVALKLGGAELQRMSTIDLIPQVSTLQVCCKNVLDLHSRLVHRCSSTLLELDIGISHARTLFYDANHQVVVYPNLQMLQLTAATIGVPIEQTSVPNVVTLPLLKELIIPMSLPFDDDVLFRGNSTRLKRLVIPMDKNAVDVLKRDRVLGNKYKNMKVTINQSYHNDDLSLVSDADINRFIGNLVGAAQSLKLEKAISVNRFVEAAPLIRGFEQLQVLDISWDRFSFFDVLRLLRVLPNLIKMSSSFDKLGMELDNVAAEELPDHIASKYCNTGKNLQFLSLRSASGLAHPVVPEYILLLALVCPKLCRVELAPHAITDFRAHIADALQSGPFSKYASQLNRFLHATY